MRVARLPVTLTLAFALLALPSCGTTETHPPLLDNGAGTSPGASDVPRTCAELRTENVGVIGGLLIVGDAAAGCPAEGLVCPLPFGPDEPDAGGLSGAAITCDGGTPVRIDAVCQLGYWNRHCETAVRDLDGS